MPLTGELTDLSLAELIEFFCNQRKTGRLMVEYPHAPAYFYLQSGSVVHASIGMLRGIEAVYYALTQSNASFKFSSSIEAPELTINQPWTSVVLEGLRRMDEGIKPRNPFPDQPDPVIQEQAVRNAEHLVGHSAVEQPEPELELPVAKSVAEQPAIQPRPSVAQPPQPPPAAPAKANISDLVADVAAMTHTEDKDGDDEPQHVPAAPRKPEFSPAFLSPPQSTSWFAQGPWKLAAIFAALILIVGGIAVPWYARGKAQRAAATQQIQASAVADTASQPAASDAGSQVAPGTEAQPTDSPEQTSTTTASADPADAARKERDARAREEARLKAKENAASQPAPAAAATSTQPAAAAGAKKAVVQVTYDENGRVTGASGSDPTALRIARQKRFPPGKAGTATVTIPIN